APGGIKRIIEVLRWQQRLAAGQEVIRVLDHRDGKARILRGALAEPLQRAPAFFSGQILALEAGREHVLEPATLSLAVNALELPVILETTGHRIDGLMADDALGGFHRGVGEP